MDVSTEQLPRGEGERLVVAYSGEENMKEIEVEP